MLALSPHRQTVPRCSAKASSRVRLIGPSHSYLGIRPCPSAPTAALLHSLPVAPASPSHTWREILLQRSRDTQATFMENAAHADICVLISYLLSAT